MKTQAPTRRTPRASCRVGCVLAALLVTLGGLRLLVAAEPMQLVGTPRAEAATVVRMPVRSSGPVDVAVDVRAWRPTSRDFEAAIVQQAERVECVPGACGFPRIRAFEDDTAGWTELEQRVLTAVLPTFEREPRDGLQSGPAAWFPVEVCTADCPGRLDAPDALAARF